MRKRYEDALDSQADGGNKIELECTHRELCCLSTAVCSGRSYFFGVYLIVEGQITQGALIGAVILGGRTMGPLSQLANTLARVNGALAAYRNLSKLIGKSFNSASTLSPISRSSLHGEIEFKNVSFKFEGAKQHTINNVSFKIPAGQKVALVGKMGSGKSTMSKLIVGMIEPTSGYSN